MSQCAFVNKLNYRNSNVSIIDCNVWLGWRVKLSFINCTSVLAMLGGVSCVIIGLKILCKISFHIFAPQALPTCLLKKNKLQSKYSKYFCAKHQTTCVSWIASQICSVCLWCVSLSCLSTTLLGRCVRWDELWVVKAGWCLIVSSVIMCLLFPSFLHTHTHTHITMCNHANSTMWWPSV